MKAASNSIITPNQLQQLINTQPTAEMMAIIEDIEVQVQGGQMGQDALATERLLRQLFTDAQHNSYNKLDSLNTLASFKVACAAFRAGIIFAHNLGMAPGCCAE